MVLSIVQKPIKFGDGTTGQGNFATDGTNFWPISVLTDSNGALITDISGLPVTGTFFQATQPISAASLPLPLGGSTASNQANQLTQETASATALGTPADVAWVSGSGSAIAILKKIASAGGAAVSVADGADVTQGTQADAAWGGSGTSTVVAALKAIYAKVAGIISVSQSGTWNVGLSAGVAAIGSIIGRSSMPVVTPVVTSNGAYSAGNEIGGLMTFAVGGAGTGGTLMSIRVTSRSILTTSLTAFVFTTNPAASTWNDKTSPAINVADIPFLLYASQMTNPIGGAGTMTIWNDTSIGAEFLAANLYVILVSVSAATLTSTSVSDITVELGMKVN